MRAIVFLRRFDGKPMALFGVEGVPSDAAPGYEQVRSAVGDFARWRTGKASDSVGEAEKLLASTTSGEVAELAWDYLCSKREVAAVERVWGAARAGSPAAHLRDHVRRNNYPTCPAPPNNCDTW